MKRYRDIWNETTYTEDELRKEFDLLKANGDTDAENFGQYLNNCLGKNGSLEEIASDYEINNRRRWAATRIAAQSEMKYEDILNVLQKYNVYGNWTMYEINNRPTDIDELQEIVEEELGLR